MIEHVPCIAAFDPGVSGAVAIITKERYILTLRYNTKIKVKDSRKTKRSRIIAAPISVALQRYKPYIAVIEELAPRGNLTGMWSHMTSARAYGAIETICDICAVPIRYVRAQSWKKHHDLIGKEKVDSVKLAEHMFGLDFTLVKAHNLAEALLMADWFLATEDET